MLHCTYLITVTTEHRRTQRYPLGHLRVSHVPLLPVSTVEQPSYLFLLFRAHDASCLLVPGHSCSLHFLWGSAHLILQSPELQRWEAQNGSTGDGKWGPGFMDQCTLPCWGQSTIQKTDSVRILKDGPPAHQLHFSRPFHRSIQLAVSR